MTAQDEGQSGRNEFVQHGSERRNSFFGEYLFLLKTRKKWWMLPLLILFLALGVLLVLSSSPAAPFIYTLF